jgi:hypothetical protein
MSRADSHTAELSDDFARLRRTHHAHEWLDAWIPEPQVNSGDLPSGPTTDRETANGS